MVAERSSSSSLTLPAKQTNRPKGRRPKALRQPATKMSHGFVFLDSHSVSEHTVREGRLLTQAFSDKVSRPSFSLFYGSLEKTFDWFKDETHLRTNILHSHCVDNIKICLCSHFVRGFFYGSQIERTGITFADKKNLDYRRFLSHLSWEQWYSGACALINALDIRLAERERALRDTRHFCERMQLLRIKSPGVTTQFIGHDELVERFGHWPALLWLAWQTSEDCLSHKLRLKNFPLEWDPLDFRTSLGHVSPDIVRLDIAAARAHLKETFFHCLERIATISSPSERFGIRDFSLSLFCNDNISFTSEYSLACPIFVRDRTAETVCDNILEIFYSKIESQQLVPTHEHLSQENDSPVSPKLEYFHSPSFVEDIVVAPLALHRETVKDISLFEESSTRLSPQQICDLQAQDGATLRLCALADTVHPLKSFSSLSVTKNPTQPLSFEAISSSTLYKYQHRFRPPVLLRSPIRATIAELSTATGLADFRLYYTETVESSDYFILAGSSQKHGFWIKSAAEQRSSSARQRQYEILGYFDAPFALPEE